MAHSSFPSNIVTDPQMLVAVTRTVAERLRSPELREFDYAVELIEQLQLLLIESQASLFVYGARQESTLQKASLHAVAPLKKILEWIFSEEANVELVAFDPARDDLSALVARFAGAAGVAEAGAGEEVRSGAAPVTPAIPAGQPASPPAAGASPADSEPQAAEAPLSAPDIPLALLHSSLRGVFTSPRRVVVVPGYLLRWLPYIGPLRLSIVVACFQAFYLNRRSAARPGLPFEAPGPLLAAVAGIAESSLWRHLDDPELAWFLKKVPYGPGEKRWVRDGWAKQTKKRPTRFLFRSTAPLTPGDAQALRTYLTDLNLPQDPAAVLSDLVRGDYRIEPRDVFPFPAPPPPASWQDGDPERCLVHNIVFDLLGISAGNASREIAALVDEFAARLLPPSDQLHLSWYFLLHWQPLLGHGPAWATILLRDRCFYSRQTGELRDTVRLKGGYQELAGALGLQRVKTVREWFPAPLDAADRPPSASPFLPGDNPFFPLAGPLAPVPPQQLAGRKRSFVREYAARFVEIIEAEADGRRQVSAFKAQVRLLDPLTPEHEALYAALFPLVQRLFSLPAAHRAGFAGAFDEAAALRPAAAASLIQEIGQAVAAIARQHGEPPAIFSLDGNEISVIAFLGAIDRITGGYPGAIGSFTLHNPGADESFIPLDPGANGILPSPDLGAFAWFTRLLCGAFERLIQLDPGANGSLSPWDPGAPEHLGLVFWAQMRGLKYLVLNHRLDEALKDYLLNSPVTIPATTTASQAAGGDGGQPAAETGLERWNLNQLLNNFSPPAQRDLLEKGASIPAVVSCLLYIASSRGENLGLGYVVERLKSHPQDGQGGVYLRIAGAGPEELIARLRSYLEYRSFQDRDWRVAMGTPSTEKILELLEHLGLDSSKFASAWG